MDCKWKSWEAWSGCSRTCGGGVRTRQRLVDVAPRFGGRYCAPHDMTEMEACGVEPCADGCDQDCELGSWGAWTACDCAPGPALASAVQKRVRTIASEPRGNGKPCNAASLGEIRSCSESPECAATTSDM